MMKRPALCRPSDPSPSGKNAMTATSVPATSGWSDWCGPDPASCNTILVTGEMHYVEFHRSDVFVRLLYNNGLSRIADCVLAFYDIAEFIVAAGHFFSEKAKKFITYHCIGICEQIQR
jgi:hypothetical protein